MLKVSIGLHDMAGVTVLACCLISSISGCSFGLSGVEEVFIGYVRNITSIAVSPDGAKLAFLYTNRINLPKIYYLYVCNRDGTGLSQIASLPSQSAAGSEPYAGIPTVMLKNTSVPCDFTDFIGNGTGPTDTFDPIPSGWKWYLTSQLRWAANGDLYLVDAQGNLVCLQQDGTKKRLIQPPTDFTSVCSNYPKERAANGDYSFRLGGFDVCGDGARLVSTQGGVFNTAGQVTSVLLRNVYPKGLVCPRFSPDGQSVAALETASGVTRFDEPPATATVAVMNLASGKKAEWALPDGWQPLDVHWLPTNRLLSAVTRASSDAKVSDEAIATFKPDGTDFQLNPQVNTFGEIEVSPDGNAMYQIGADGDFSSSLYSIDSATGKRQKIVDSNTLPKDEAMYAE